MAERSGLRTKTVLAVGAVGVAWASAMGCSVHKLAEANNKIDSDPILRAHRLLLDAEGNLTNYLITRGGATTPANKPEAEANLTSATSIVQDQKVLQEIQTVLENLKSKPISKDSLHYREDRDNIEEIRNQLPDKARFSKLEENTGSHKDSIYLLGLTAIVAGILTFAAKVSRIEPKASLKPNTPLA